LDRKASAISRKYYDMFPAKNKKVVVVQEQQIPNNPQYKKGIKFDKILWTKERVEILKDELNKKITIGYTITVMCNNLSKRLDMGYSTVHLKLSRLKKKFKVNNVNELYNSLLSVKDIGFLNDESVLKKTTKKEQKANVPSKSNVLLNEEKQIKLSFWQKINPFYRIKLLEKQIDELKRKSK
jgi:hypothetical protein